MLRSLPHLFPTAADGCETRLSPRKRFPGVPLHAIVLEGV